METKFAVKTCWLLNIFAYTIIFSFFTQLSHSMTLTRNRRAFSYIANETVCMVDNIVYHDGDPVPTDDPCESCKCRPPGFSCVLRECKVKPGCKQIRREGECCPEYQCGCEHNGKFFNDGDRIPNAESPCYSCFCQGSSITCALADCKFRFDCEPEYVANECCPRYDHCQPEPTLPTSTLKSVLTSLLTSPSPILNATTIPTTLVSLASVTEISSNITIPTTTPLSITTIKSLPTTMASAKTTTQAPQTITASSPNLSSTSLTSISDEVVKTTSTDVPKTDVQEVTTTLLPSSEVIESVDATTLPSSLIESTKKNLTSPSTPEIQDITTLSTTEESITTISLDQAISSSTGTILVERPTTLSTATSTVNSDPIFSEKPNVSPDIRPIGPGLTTIPSLEKDVTAETTQTPQDEIPTGLVIIKSTENHEKILTTVTPSTWTNDMSNLTSSSAKLIPTQTPPPASGNHISYPTSATENFNASSSATSISSDKGVSSAIPRGDDEINSSLFTTTTSPNYPVTGSELNSTSDFVPEIGLINGTISDNAPDNISIEDNFPTTSKWIPSEELEAEHKNTESNDLQPIRDIFIIGNDAPMVNTTNTTTVSSNTSTTTSLEKTTEYDKTTEI